MFYWSLRQIILYITVNNLAIKKNGFIFSNVICKLSLIVRC